VVFDMVIAITAGIVLASLLFMREIAEMTRIHDITDNKKLVGVDVPTGWKIFKINGPLFFAAADRVFGELALLSAEQKAVILQLDGVSILDSGGVSALNRFIDSCRKLNIRVYLTDFQYQPLRTLSKAGFKPDGVISETFSTLAEALNQLQASPVEAPRPA
jgi:SulP family sulfate permease